MMSSARNNNSSNSKYPFTETQWQELEHQALIFKYMISGIPIPPELIFTVQRSLISSHYPNQQAGGWGCYGRKADPEPGRCRRTDGKKWRCSKEAFPDSKYCERHMHRTKNRSRKPVESSSSAPPTTNTTSTTTTSTSTSVLSLSSPSSSSSSPSSSVVVTDHHNINTHPYLNTTTTYPYSHRNNTHENNTPREMILASNYSDKDFRYFLPETSGTLTSLPESYTPFGGYQSSQLLPTDHHHHDVATSKPQNQQMHHFFSEKWPQKDATDDSWLNDIDHDASTAPFSTTQLSMSLPMSSNHNLFAPNSRLHNGG